MGVVNVILDVEGKHAWDRDTLTAWLTTENSQITVGAMPRGTDRGLPSAYVISEQPDGTTIVVEFTLRELLAAVMMLGGHYGLLTP